MPIPDFVPEALTTLELDVEPATLNDLAAYLDMLLQANQQMNLTAVRDHDAAWMRLIVDSLTVLPGLPETQSGKVMDVGTGGGLPGIPLAIARPDLDFTLVEATGKKCDFLRRVCKQLGLDRVTVVNGRAETLGHERRLREAYDVVISRAVGPLAVALELMMPFVRVDGVALLMKGPKLEEEMQDAGDALALLGAGDIDVFAAYPESFDNSLVVAQVRKASSTPKAYPRQPGLPKKQPLGSEPKG